MLGIKIIVGNIISLVAAVFMCLSATAARRRTVYIFQLIECGVLMLAQLVFGYPAAAFALALGAVRNMLILLEKYSMPVMVSFVFLILSFAVLTIDGVSVEILPIIATLIFTIGSYFARGVVETKIVFILMLVFWSVYSFIIRDFSTAVTNTVSAILALFAIITHKHADIVGKRRKIKSK